MSWIRVELLDRDRGGKRAAERVLFAGNPHRDRALVGPVVAPYLTDGRFAREAIDVFKKLADRRATRNLIESFKGPSPPYTPYVLGALLSLPVERGELDDVIIEILQDPRGQ